MRAEVVFINQMVAEGTVACIVDWAAVTAIDAGYGTELNVV